MRFSLVVAAYNVAGYLEEFFGCLEQQTFPHTDFEVVVVDDGSSDDTLESLRARAAAATFATRVLTKANGGQASARNLGLEHAAGEWVSFLDPDDLVRKQYLAKVSTFLDREVDADMVATNRLLLNGATGEVSDAHPLRWMFRAGDAVRNLDQDRSYFHGSAPAAFYRRSVLRETGLRFSEKVRPNFEDGHFSSHYLLGYAEPRVGFLRSAEYLYRKRADGSSTLQRSTTELGRYLDVLRHGYLEVLVAARAKYGVVPVWLQNFVIYELTGYFSAYESNNGAASPPQEHQPEFHDLLVQIRGHLDDAVIEACEHPALKPEYRMALLHGFSEEPWAEDAVVISDFDRSRALSQVSYWFAGSQPEEQIMVRGKEIAPAHATTRTFVAFGRVLLRERILWLPVAPTVDIRIGGRPRPVLTRRAEVARSAVRSPNLARVVAAKGTADSWYARLGADDAELLAEAASRSVRRRFEEAWVLMDRVHDADDSGEHLYRWLRTNRPEVNAWFVVERGTPAWSALRRSRHRKRVVAHGSRRWKLLMLNAQHLISSHADEPIVNPPALRNLPKKWRFTFLQHGVIKDDLSRWLNAKPISTFVTSTAAEYESIVGDSNYRYSSKEVVLTGLPRFDHVLAAGRSVPEGQRDLLLVAPTWREWLVKPLASGSQRREVVDQVLDSEFVRSWLAFLTDPVLTEEADRHDLKIALLPHPNLAALVRQLDLPAGIEVFGFESSDVRRLFARSAVVVTDYSSMAFNAAYIDRPVVYFQFDADRALGGGHIRPGYFDYQRDGFGPVARTVDQGVRETVKVLDDGRHPVAPYDARIAATFAQRDGRCCERTYDAIAASTQR